MMRWIFDNLADNYLLIFSTIIFFLLFTFMMEGFKFSDNKIIKFLQKTLIIILLFIIAQVLLFIFNVGVVYTSELSPEDAAKIKDLVNNKEVNITANVVIDRSLAEVILQGINSGDLWYSIKDFMGKWQSILPDFNFEEFLKTLSREEMLALGGLLFNQIIVSYVVTIILILYGDYLIKRFDLENKYPKIAKFIQLRRKLQSYYLKLCFLWIFLALLPQYYVYIFILLPRITDFFN